MQMTGLSILVFILCPLPGAKHARTYNGDHNRRALSDKKRAVEVAVDLELDRALAKIAGLRRLCGTNIRVSEILPATFPGFRRYYRAPRGRDAGATQYTKNLEGKQNA